MVGEPTTLLDPGAIAQLGERLLCKQEVTGSIPVGSTRADEIWTIGSTKQTGQSRAIDTLERKEIRVEKT